MSLAVILPSCFMLVAPTFIAFFTPTSIFVKYHRQMLAASIGTISSFLFIELIPSTFYEIAMESKEHPLSKFSSVLLSGGILLAMMIAASLDLMSHGDIDQIELKAAEEEEQESQAPDTMVKAAAQRIESHKATISNRRPSTRQSEKNINDKQTQVPSTEFSTESAKQGCFFLLRLPGAIKSMVITELIGCMLNGMLVRFHPIIVVPFFVLELTDSMSQMSIYYNFGLKAKQALCLRLLTDILCPITATTLYFVEMSQELFESLAIHAHCLLIGFFLYIMLVNLWPLLIENGGAAKQVEQTQDARKGGKLSAFASFVVAFCFVAGIVLSDLKDFVTVGE